MLIARGQASGLDFAELAFQAEELQALIAQNEGKHISDEEAKQVIKETEGWITGLQFSNIKLPSSGDQSNLFNYFKQQVLDRQPPELKEFILRTSLLEDFDAELCEKVLAPLYDKKQDWQNWIKLIANNNVFALPVGENQDSLRYHHLFRDFIRDQFKAERPNEVSPILANLQLAYESFGEWEKAHHICKQLNDSTALAEMIERAGTTMIQHAHLTLESWLNELPSVMLKTRPSLLSIRGVIVGLKGDFHESLNILNESEQKFRLAEDTHGLALTLSRRATINRFLGEYQNSLKDADELIELTEETPELSLLYAEGLRIKGLTLFRLGQARQAVTFFEKSLGLYEQLKETGSVPILLMETGMAYRAVADFEQAKKAYETALLIWRREGNLFHRCAEAL
ncbi:MAG: tetratricopeptide repeat protein [Anaerolineales bacterium]|nr:tetratricopeptide repeat protein [Anaerolineales bacterium]